MKQNQLEKRREKAKTLTLRDELDLLWGDPLDAFLNDMVSILIFDASKNVPIKLLDKGNLLVNLDLLQRLLNNPAPIHLKGQR